MPFYEKSAKEINISYVYSKLQEHFKKLPLENIEDYTQNLKDIIGNNNVNIKINDNNYILQIGYQRTNDYLKRPGEKELIDKEIKQIQLRCPYKFYSIKYHGNNATEVIIPYNKRKTKHKKLNLTDSFLNYKNEVKFTRQKNEFILSKLIELDSNLNLFNKYIQYETPL
jgi:hypothetical protein